MKSVIHPVKGGNMKIYELDLNNSRKIYEDNNGKLWRSEWGDLYLAEATKFVVYIQEYYDTLSEMFKLTFKQVAE
jgi:hypothetical protein